MTSRAAIVQLALADNGYNDGKGYGCPSKYSQDMGHGAEYDCADGVSYWFRHAGVPLPVMQPGDRDGYSYCPDAYNYGKAHNAIIPSWQAQPGDIVLFSWNNNGQADHTGIVVSWSNGVLLTIEADSGPSNVDQFKGQGGTHKHTWPCPAGSGNDLILAVLDASKLVHLDSAHPKPPAPKPAASSRILQYQTPAMTGDDVKQVQAKLHVAADGEFGPQTKAAVVNFQKAHKLTVDGVVGPATRKALGV